MATGWTALLPVQRALHLHVAAALQELRGVCAFFKLLGTYPIDVH